VQRTIGMKSFLKYAEQLDGLLDEVQWGQCTPDHTARIQASLSDQAARVLHETADSASIWKAGAYFTSPQLANSAIEPVTKQNGVLSRPVFDPTCGAGDLLLRWADDLPVARDLNMTLAKWGSLLGGRDVFSEFVRVAKRRLALKAIARGARLPKGSAPKIDEFFPNLQRGDARKSRPVDTRLTFVMNPPFGSVKADEACKWGSGKVSLAAVLFESCIKQSPPRTRIVAILPDVLRTGTRYHQWRTTISEQLRVERVQPYGRFDEHADIDVFIVEGTVGEGRPVEWWRSPKEAEHGRVGDFFDVSVGAVVPHRDQNRGSWYPFATSRSVSPWKTISNPAPCRRFEGTTVVPPFATVRRTSSPRDSQRAVGSIISGSRPVAVENHLLVAKPRHGDLYDCEFLLKNLRDPQTKVWLDERIRCRHLTVGILRELPLWEAP
jgi:hypothetical protein